jgi:hypothetical protein
MSCGDKFNTGSCVCDVLAEIADAQTDDVSDCLGSCSESIRELLGGLPASNFNTVPVQLLCEDGCGEVFEATGFRRNPTAPSTIQSATSTFFRVDSINLETGCVVLEILCSTLATQGQVTCPETLTGTLTRTGVCITVDCKCFCGVVCLPAMNLPKA